jgi:hypothetical protein
MTKTEKIEIDMRIFYKEKCTLEKRISGIRKLIYAFI